MRALLEEKRMQAQATITPKLTYDTTTTNNNHHRHHRHHHHHHHHQQPMRQWMNMSIVKGGTSANLLVKGMATEWGRKLYGRTLLSNIAQSIYKERDAVVKGLRDAVRQQLRMGAPKTMEPLLNVPSADFEFAVKIRVSRRSGERREGWGSGARRMAHGPAAAESRHGHFGRL